MKVWYRRTSQPYAFPATNPDDVEVAFVPQDTGPADDDWSVATLDDDHPESEIIPKTTHPGIIADAMICEVAIYRAAGVPLPLPNDYSEYSPEDLDESRAEDYEELCDAVALLYGEDVGHCQRIHLYEKLSNAYRLSHDLDFEEDEATDEDVERALEPDSN